MACSRRLWQSRRHSGEMQGLPTRRSSHPPTRRELGLIACLLAALISPGCRKAADAGVVKDHLTIGLSLPKLSPNEVSADRVSGTMKLEAAVAVAQDGKPAKRIFDEWSWIEHGHALELHLQPKILFHDGTPLTAELAADILRAYLTSPDQTHISSVDTVTATDAAHVVIRTTRQEGLLLSDLSMIDFELPGKPGVGTGPFRATDDPTAVDAFDKYYLGAPVLKHVKISEYPSQRAAWTAMMRGEIDMLHEVSPEASEFVERESSVRSTTFLRPYYNAIAFNLNHPVLSQREVRLALNEAIDRQAIVDVSMRGLGKPAAGPIWPQFWAYSSAVPGFSFDPLSAATRLEALGLVNGGERQPGRMPSRFSFKCLVLENEPVFNRIALRVQRQLYEIGVDMEVVSLPLRPLLGAIYTGNFDAALMEFIGSRSLNWAYIFWHSPGPGFASPLPSGYKAADAALDRFRAATDEAEIKASVEGMQRIFRDEPPAIFLAWQERSRALSKAFEIPDESSGDILGTIRQWRGVPLAGQSAK
ncbi:MAG: ABC transporter substrate-binding protein, partial [Vicinamibacterales bacterium]